MPGGEGAVVDPNLFQIPLNPVQVKIKASGRSEGVAHAQRNVLLHKFIIFNKLNIRFADKKQFRIFLGIIHCYILYNLIDKPVVKRN